MKKSTVHKVSAAALAVSMAALTTPAASADAQPPAPLAVGGDKVALGTGSDQGPLLGAGMHQAEIPARTERSSFRVQRDKSETLKVGIVGSYATKSWQGIGSTSDTFSFTYKTASGVACNTGSNPASNRLNVPQSVGLGLVTGSLTIEPGVTAQGREQGSDPSECRDATEFIVTVNRQVKGSDAPGVPTQIDVVKQPQVTGGSSKASINGLADMSTAALDPTSEAKPGEGWMTATTLAPGGYSLNAAPGKPMLFRVHLTWGQRLSVGWQLPKAGQKLSTKQPLRARLQLFNPSLVQADLIDTSRSTTRTIAAGSSQPVELGAYTAPIADGNSDLDVAGDQQRIWNQTFPGWYYIYAVAGPDPDKVQSEGFDETSTLPGILSVRVEGQAQAGPTMAMKQPPAGAISGPSEGSKVVLPVWGSLSALGTLAVVGLAAVLWRRSRPS